MKVKINKFQNKKAQIKKIKYIRKERKTKGIIIQKKKEMKDQMKERKKKERN